MNAQCGLFIDPAGPGVIDVCWRKLNRVISEALYPTRGIIAGCALAAMLANLVLLEGMDGLISAAHRVDYGVLVYDTGLTRQGSTIRS